MTGEQLRRRMAIGPMRWVRLWTREGIVSQPSWTLEQEGFFTRLLRHAGNGTIHGKICVTEEIGYSHEQMMALVHVVAPDYHRLIKDMVDLERIAVDEKGIISILNWEKYQSEYARQDRYRGMADYPEKHREYMQKYRKKKEGPPLTEEEKDSASKNFRKFQELWNETAGKVGWAKCKDVTPKRLKAFNTRMKENRNFLVKLPEVIAIMARTPWFLGRNERGWKPGPDYILQPDKWLKLLEREERMPSVARKDLAEVKML